MEKITAELRVTNLNVKPFTYKVEGMEDQGGESVELRAFGYWEETREGERQQVYPVSLHLTTYPGHGIVPALGDTVIITVQRS
jgi:hypothetical protein